MTVPSGPLPDPRAPRRVGTQGMFAQRKKIRERKKGPGSSNLISTSTVLLGLPLRSRSHGFDLGPFFMIKNVQPLWKLSPPYVQRVGVHCSSDPWVRRVCHRLAVWLSLALAAPISSLELRAYLHFQCSFSPLGNVGHKPRDLAVPRWHLSTYRFQSK